MRIESQVIVNRYACFYEGGQMAEVGDIHSNSIQLEEGDGVSSQQVGVEVEVSEAEWLKQFLADVEKGHFKKR